MCVVRVCWEKTTLPEIHLKIWSCLGCKTLQASLGIWEGFNCLRRQERGWSFTHHQEHISRNKKVQGDSISTIMPNQNLRSGFTSMKLHRNWMWKSKQIESLMVPDMDVQDWSEPAFASVVFEPFTQLCRDTRVNRLNWKKLPMQQK